MELIDGLHLNTYVAPQLLEEFRNYNDDFMAVLPGAPEGAISADGIRMNKLINNVGFLVNNENDFVAKKMLGKKGLVEWDKLDTEPTKVDDADVRALPFDLRNEVRVKHSEAWKIGSRDYVLRKLAPAAAAAGMPILRATGANDGTGRLRLTFADLIKYYTTIGLLNLPQSDKLNLTLCPDHQQDLLLQQSETSNYRDGIVINKETGKLERFYKLKIWENNAAPVYTAAGALKAQGAVAVAGDRAASIFFYAPNTVWHVDSVKILYSPETTDTKSADPTSEFRLQSYALCDKTQNYGFGALLSGIAV
jgi:hypothetical protein